MFVFDAIPLIYLAKAKVLKYVCELEEEILIPETVFQEVVVEGKNMGFPDAIRVEKLVDKGIFEIVPAERGIIYDKLEDNNFLSKADMDVLEIALQENGIAVMDDSYPRTIAKIEGIRCRGTFYLIFRMLNEKIVDKEEAKNIIDEIIEEGWYCTTDLYSHIMKKLEEY